MGPQAVSPEDESGQKSILWCITEREREGRVLFFVCAVAAPGASTEEVIPIAGATRGIRMRRARVIRLPSLLGLAGERR